MSSVGCFIDLAICMFVMLRMTQNGWKDINKIYTSVVDEICIILYNSS
ncbi:hypothetical protein XCR1_1650020 [Xenorhabdus cabanillasii JM26]|uniref:Uncharacterized protein n=1 Tax=Xenorhabdus cabanillasii JM26 TaxID=1427517 RepID=W1IUS5_9GAMM|nr:hypothetical protein XCR1_1650020 [Xenorhabdus cabanillasii JM26]